MNTAQIIIAILCIVPAIFLFGVSIGTSIGLKKAKSIVGSAIDHLNVRKPDSSLEHLPGD
jgi:hypothetical protein